MSAILLKEETYKKLKHDANIKVTGYANMYDNGEGKTINVNPKMGWYVDASDSLDGSTIIHKVKFVCTVQSQQDAQLIYYNVTYTFSNTAGTIDFLFPRGVVSAYACIYWKSTDCTGYDTDTNNYKIIPNSNNINPIYDNQIISISIANDKAKVIKRVVSNITGTMAATTELVNTLALPSIIGQSQTYLIEGENIVYESLNKRLVGNMNVYLNNIYITENTDTWIVWNKENGSYGKQTTATIADENLTALVGYIRIKTNGNVEDISKFYTQETFKGATNRTERFISSFKTETGSDSKSHVYFKYGTKTIDGGGRELLITYDANWTLVI
jgi:hypothetical protein